LWSILGYIIICSMAIWMFLYNKKEDELKNANH
jgi:cbb3-type cytochrome oxidase subunit 3